VGKKVVESHGLSLVFLTLDSGARWRRRFREKQHSRGGAACQQKAAVRNRALTGPSLPQHGDTKLGQVVTGKSRR
jgi:hypothetical protein